MRIPLLRMPNGEGLPLPAYMTELAAGMDIPAAKACVLHPGDIALVSTGFAMALPEGFEAQIRPRSGLAIRHGITVVNAPGTIDADYRGEIRIGLINLGKKSVEIKRGDRIAQMVIAPVCRISWQETGSLEDTDRGDGGFGHTGSGVMP
ncbi:deoxyuridine 5'-triphosphate nucleotidohydrolase [Desulfobotulus alkaliphilus]|uniref:Deoxyuridine 5'-triphosphate nucleotidohydrolase n=1 Tax=Desulfobotulus alkaliphilus TaxID=622671 RepID=A0A562RC94_9BACT|nr:dUTP diphosphatase [Desulfobotulus alkaliphilus]TWI66050.1 deoxyuridine 5'-triphosphate nucleotidohydrolase [Desulfobotulus alkaliphilus]